jgi:hypothetical protein
LLTAGTILVGAYVDGVMRAAAEIVPDRTARQAEAVITIEQGFDDREFGRMLTERIVDEARRYHLSKLRVFEKARRRASKFRKIKTTPSTDKTPRPRKARRRRTRADENSTKRETANVIERKARASTSSQRHRDSTTPQTRQCDVRRVFAPLRLETHARSRRSCSAWSSTTGCAGATDATTARGLRPPNAGKTVEPQLERPAPNFA